MHKIYAGRYFLIIIGMLFSIFGKNETYRHIPLNYLGYLFLTIGMLSAMGILPKGESDTLVVGEGNSNCNEENAKKWLKGLGIFTVIIGIVAFRAYQVSIGMELHILNGFNETCTIEFESGKVILVEGNGHDKVTLSAGDYEVTISKPNALTYKKLFSLKQKSYVKSFFGYENVFALNPYKGAIVEGADVTYAVSYASNYGNVESNYFLGSDFWVFENCDYPFEEMPEEISMEGNSETRSCLLMHTYEEGQVTYLTDFLLEKNVPSHLILNLLGTHVKNSQLNLTTISKYISLAHQLKKDIKLIDKVAEVNINDLEFQRYYQSVLAAHKGEDFVIKKYQEKLKNDPKNSNLLYLVGRILTDNQQTLEHFEQAIEVDPDHAFSYYGIGYSRMMSGNFKEALKLFSKANKLDPISGTISSALFEAKLASKEYNSLIKICSNWNGQEWRGYDFYNTIELHNLNGNKTAAVTELKKYNNRCNKELNKDYRGEYKANALVHNSYYSMDKKTMKTALEKVQDKYDKNYYNFNYSLWSNQPNSAEIFLKKNEAEASPDSILLYISYMRAGNRQKAQNCLNNCISYYNQCGDSNLKMVADILKGKESYRGLIEKVKELTVQFREKREILVALAIIYPYKKRELLSLAEKFNYSLNMPHNFLAESIKDLKTKRL